MGVVEDYLFGSASKAQLSRRYSFCPHQIALWRKRYSEGRLNENSDAVSLAKDARVRELERLVGKQALQIELLKKPSSTYRREISNDSSIASGSVPRQDRSKKGVR